VDLTRRRARRVTVITRRGDRRYSLVSGRGAAERKPPISPFRIEIIEEF
jgi:hypothetical protein